MTSRIIIYAYKIASRSARSLQAELADRGHRVIRVRENGNYRPRLSDVVIGWGNPRTPAWNDAATPPAAFLNRPDTVARNNDKLLFLENMQEADPWGDGEGIVVRCPPYTTSRDTAESWIEEGSVVMARRLLRSSGGNGIVVCTTQEELVDAPLYTKYVKKRDEYRVHIFNDEVIRVQHKRKRREDDEVDYKIRNHDNGWVFCVQDVEPPEDVISQARHAMAASGLCFGAVDVIYNAHYDKAYVLEINTAPGLEGTTLADYAEAISAYVGG